MSSSPHLEKALADAVPHCLTIKGQSWKSARAAARDGHLGVVSLVSVEKRLMTALQQGDVGGAMRWALDHFPLSEIAREITAGHYCPGGLVCPPNARADKTIPVPSAAQVSSLLLAGAFAEVFLAKSGHDGVVGIVWPDQTDLDDLAMLSGAMLANVDCVIVPPEAVSFVTQAIDMIGADEFAAWLAPAMDRPALPSVVVVDSASSPVRALSAGF